MASYRIEWKRSALKELRRLPNELIRRVVNSVEDLSTNPFPHGFRKLYGGRSSYRIRLGDYRVIYSVWESLLLIEIVKVGHRKDVYK